MDFAAYAGLRDPHRDNLEPNPEKEPDLFVDLDGLIDRCMARLASKAPKLVLMGDYGTGKTHLLHVLAAQIDETRFQPVYAKLDAFGRWAESRHLHDALLSALESKKLLIPAIEGAVDADDVDQDVKHAFDLLRKNPKDPDARAWILARGPTPTKARKVGFSAPLSTIAKGVFYARIWRAIADGYIKSTGRELLFLLDESETFQDQVDASRAADMGVAIREMFDAGNRSYGVVMGLTAPRLRAGGLAGHPLSRPDVMTRIQNVLHKIPDVTEPTLRRVFLTGLLDKLLKNRGGFLTDKAMDLLITSSPQWAKDVALIARAPVQREYVKLLDRLAKEAYQMELPLPLKPKDIETLGSRVVVIARGES